MPILPAVVNAVYDAVGVRFRDLPLTPDVVFKGIERKRKSLKLDDCMDLPSPRLEHGPMQEVLSSRADEHKLRDKARQRTEDTSHYVNGVLFGFDPNVPLEDQVDGWRMATEPDPKQLAELGLAGKAWLKKTQREMGGDS